jgi:hypothetical protein
MNAALVGLVIGISIVSALGILAARISRSRVETKRKSIGFSRTATDPDFANLNKEDPEGMKLAGGGNAKSQFRVHSSGR